jgi:hypothetical protein
MTDDATVDAAGMPPDPPSDREQAVVAFEHAMATGVRTWIDDALLPGEAEEFAEHSFIAGYLAAKASDALLIQELEKVAAAAEAQQKADVANCYEGGPARFAPFIAAASPAVVLALLDARRLSVANPLISTGTPEEERHGF